jgi:nucleotide-binding universal stress UspA family protein
VPAEAGAAVERGFRAGIPRAERGRSRREGRVIMKNVLLLLDDDPGREARLQAALDVARALDGLLMCFETAGVAADAGAFEPAGAGREELEERLAKENVPWTIQPTTGSFAYDLDTATGLADLILVGSESEGSRPLMGGMATALLLKTGKPVLIVPEASRGFDVRGPALVAWDGSLPAMAAVTAAVPLLTLTSKVRILEVQGTSHGALDAAARYLSRHGIEADVDRLACFRDAPHETSAVIQDRVEQTRCTWCVMGAYGHSAVKQALLGGVTRRMLATARVPVFMAH